jgi:hypothetical protein
MAMTGSVERSLKYEAAPTELVKLPRAEIYALGARSRTFRPIQIAPSRVLLEGRDVVNPSEESAAGWTPK